MTKKSKQKQGICPKCGSPFEYKGTESPNEGVIIKSVYCTNDNCGFNGTEWYKVVFVGIEET